MACARCGKKARDAGFIPASSKDAATRPRPALRQRAVRRTGVPARGSAIQPAQQPPPPTGG